MLIISSQWLLTQCSHFNSEWIPAAAEKSPPNLQCWDFIQVRKTIERNSPTQNPAFSYTFLLPFRQQPGNGTWVDCCMKMPNLNASWCLMQDTAEHFKYTFTVTGQKGQCLANVLDSAVWKSDFFFIVSYVSCIGSWFFICCSFYFILPLRFRSVLREIRIVLALVKSYTGAPVGKQIYIRKSHS